MYGCASGTASFRYGREYDAKGDASVPKRLPSTYSSREDRMDERGLEGKESALRDRGTLEAHIEAFGLYLEIG